MDSMIQSIFLTILSTLSPLFLLIYFFYYHYHGARNNNRPPPRAAGALPIIGHLHLFSTNQLLHNTLGSMSDKYGPVFTIKLGSHENLVVSSLEIAKECFTTLDKVFADRPKTTATRILSYDFSMFSFAPYGPYWRHMRKIATLELLSHRRVDMLYHLRASEVRTSLKELYDSSKQGGLEDMKQWFGDLTLSASVRMVGGKRFVGSEEGRMHQKMIRDFFYYFGVFVLEDAIPSLGWLDLQGHRKRMKRVAKELDVLIGKWMEEHKERRSRIAGEGVRVIDQDFMDVMLTYMEDAAELTDDFDADTICKSTCLNMILGGSDTVMVTLTWALSLLLNHPHVLKKAQEEVYHYVPKERHVEESDITNLVYLQAVVKETLRLYPPSPIIGLHSSLEDCTISPAGYSVPSGTRLIVNIWKIQRDGDLWPEPLQFRPERFLTSHKDIDVRGQNFELIPFGSGRRSCPGTSLALQMVHFTLASLLHCYELSRPDDVEIDMTESPGTTNLKATPLQIYVTPRLHPQVFVVASDQA
ncbi:hypothetical protein ACS0TY_028651 [Phlomoides rotata]